jgi:hypothetical protein
LDGGLGDEMSDEKPREFWLAEGPYIGFEVFDSSNVPEEFNPAIHLIDYAAYDQLRLERDALAAKLADIKKWCPCGGVILADTENWPVPLCSSCCDFVVDELFSDHEALRESLKEAAQAIENYCNAHHVWSINKNHMTYQGSNEQQFLDALAKIKARHGDLK